MLFSLSCLSLSIVQHYILWHYNEKLCGIEYLSEIAHDR